MTVTNQDIKEIKEAISGAIHERKSDRIVDALTKVGVALTLAGVIGIFNTVDVIKSSINELEKEQVLDAEWRELGMKQIEVFRLFMREDRFTRKHFDDAMLSRDEKIHTAMELLKERRETVALARELAKEVELIKERIK